jgi:hypothetical protein
VKLFLSYRSISQTKSGVRNKGELGALKQQEAQEGRKLHQEIGINQSGGGS